MALSSRHIGDIISNDNKNYLAHMKKMVKSPKNDKMINNNK